MPHPRASGLERIEILEVEAIGPELALTRHQYAAAPLAPVLRSEIRPG